jgi:hypothetical protein
MKKLLALLLLLVVVGLFSYGQEFGSLRGVVKDENAIPLPGVTVTLSGSKIAPMTAITTAGGHFRFMNLPIADDYIVRFALDGFQTKSQEMVRVAYNMEVNLDILMSPAVISEEVTVVSQAPVIDTKRANVGVNVSEEMIMRLPTARNPWVIMAMVPGMLLDREDVGGNEGGQQSNYHGHGSSADDNTWNIDGANITDNSALGAAPSYYNIAGYEELQINYGSNDIRQQTGGVQINMISKRGGNRYSGTFYLDVERNAWQSDNVPQALKDDLDYTAAGINRLYLYGANFGGPLIKDKAWFYMSYGIQDIDALTLAGGSDKTWLASGYARLDFQLSNSTRANFFAEYDNKQKWGRAWVGYTTQDADTLWNQSGPGYLYKGEIDQTFGSNFFINVKFIYTDGGFGLYPSKEFNADTTGEYLTWSYYPTFYMSGNTYFYDVNRDSMNINLNGNYFIERFLGASHEFRFGVDYMTAMDDTLIQLDGNTWNYYYGERSWLPTGQYWVSEQMRPLYTNYQFKRYSAYLQDTMSFGRLSVNVGLRFDREQSMLKDTEVAAHNLFPEFMPALSIDKLDPGVKWNVLSPRLSLSYDLFGNGKDVVKFSVARYGSQSGDNLIDNINPLAWTSIYFIWQDYNADSLVTRDELFGLDWSDMSLKDPSDPDYWYSYTPAVNPNDPYDLTPQNRYDANYNSPLLDEISLAYQKELFTDFVGSLELFYKKYHRQTWIRSMNADGELETEDNYYIAGHDDTVDADIYGRTENFPYEYYSNHEKAFDRYLGAQLVMTKRLSNGWMLGGSFTYADWRRHYEGEYLGVMHDVFDSNTVFGLNNRAYFEGGVVAPETSGSGMQDIFVNSRWNFKLSGLVQLPLGIDFSGVITAREGFVKPNYVIVDAPGQGLGSIELYGNEDGASKFGDDRLPAFWMVNLRLEKTFQVTDTSTVTIAADAFNLTNSAHPLQQETQITADTFGRDLRILNPRIFRLGVRFNF